MIDLAPRDFFKKLKTSKTKRTAKTVLFSFKSKY